MVAVLAMAESLAAARISLTIFVRSGNVERHYYVPPDVSRLL